MERFDPLELLAAIERHRVTHVQLVPTHMIRLLRLSEEERSRFDLSSLQMVVHAAAPCPVEVKQACLDWLGPIVHEFYSGSEGAGLCYIGPEDWLAHPGSVGKSMTGAIHIVGDDGDELPVGEEGEVWFETNRTFEYHRDPEKTKARLGPARVELARRRRPGRRGRLPVPHRPGLEHDHQRRREHLPPRDRGRPRHAPGRRRRRRDRHARPRHGRAGHRLRAPAPRRRRRPRTS